ncbi:MAG: hypothetical protein ACLR9W_03280 [Enterobacter hormaechei]
MAGATVRRSTAGSPGVAFHSDRVTSAADPRGGGSCWISCTSRLTGSSASSGVVVGVVKIDKRDSMTLNACWRWTASANTPR